MIQIIVEGTFFRFYKINSVGITTFEIYGVHDAVPPTGTLFGNMGLMINIIDNLVGLRDWSLITGGGGGLKKGRRRGDVKFYPYEKGGQKIFCHAKGGAQKVLG